MSAGGAPTSQDTEPATPHTCISSAAARPKPAPTASEAPQRKPCQHVKAKTPLRRGYAVPEVGLEPHSSPCNHRELPKTYRIRPSPTDIRPDPKPKVWTLSTPSFCPFQALPNCRKNALLPVHETRGNQLRAVLQGDDAGGSPHGEIDPPQRLPFIDYATSQCESATRAEKSTRVGDR